MSQGIRVWQMQESGAFHPARGSATRLLPFSSELFPNEKSHNYELVWVGCTIYKSATKNADVQMVSGGGQ